MAYKTTYHEDSDADDEFERSVFVSATVEPDLSPTDSDMTSPEHTPTTFTHSLSGTSHVSPTSLVTHWTPKQCADWVSAFAGLGLYADAFIEESINGEALVALQHQDLKDLGMTSVGHRLTVLKGVYDIKVKQNIPLDPDHYVPLSAEQNGADNSATQDDIARVIESIRLRDQRIIAAESELRSLKEEIHRLLDDNRKFREETLPMIRVMKDRSHPLPNPEPPLATPTADIKPEKMGSSLSRKFSTKRLFLGSTPKNPSPTIGNHSIQAVQDTSTSTDMAAAALAASSHLTTSITSSQQSPNQVQQLSPTSPAYNVQAATPASRTFPRGDGPLATPRSNNQQVSTPHDEHPNTHDLSNHYTPDRGAAQANNPNARRPAILSTQPSNMSETSRYSTLLPPATSVPATTTAPTSAHREPKEKDKDKDNNELLKSFRVSVEDPCHKVLPVALKRYQINDDWRQYALYIVHGDQERCLGLEEKPLMLFKQLDREGRKPMFMLRKHASPAGEGWSSGHNSSTPGGII